MVYIEGYKDEVTGNISKRKNGFFMDRYEVTNKQFKEFVDNGGYRNQEYWKNKFIKRWKRYLPGRKPCLSLQTKAEGQGHLPGKQEIILMDRMIIPVTGISWYEAAAYAEYAGKSLPTADHWDSGAGVYIAVFYYFI